MDGRNTGVDETRRAESEQLEHDGMETELAEPRVPGNDPQVLREGAKVVLRRDSARWGSIWAGLFAAVTTFLLLELLALGSGLLSINLDGGASQTSAWVSAIIGLIAFFIGGLVAGMTSSVRGTITGLLNGFLVWALGTVLILVLSALGLGQIFGALGNVVGQLGLLQGGLNVPGLNLDPQQLLGTLRVTALAAFFSLLVSAITAALGGWLGGRTEKPLGRTADIDRV